MVAKDGTSEMTGGILPVARDDPTRQGLSPGARLLLIKRSILIIPLLVSLLGGVRVVRGQHSR